MATEDVKYCPWPCPHGCVGSNGKAWQNKGFRTKCQKCEKGPKPGQRKRIDSMVNPKGHGKGGPGTGKGSGKRPGEKSPERKELDKLVHTIAQLSKTVEVLANEKSKAQSTRMPSAAGGTEEGGPAVQAGAQVELEQLQARLKMDQDSIKHWKSCDDSHAEGAIKFHEDRIEATKEQIQRSRD